MDCSSCKSYQDTNGRGGKACLKCPKYRDFQVKNCRRQTIRYEVIPQAILEQVEDLTKEISILDELRKLPLELSTPLLMRYILGATNYEIADYFRQASPTFSQRKIATALAVIKKALKTP